MGSNSDVKNLQDFAGSALNVATQVSTAGLVGYDKDTGKVKMGFETHGADEALGSITGRNLQREMMQQQNENLVKAETQRQLDQQSLDSQKQQKDLQGSLASGNNSIISLLQSGKVGLADAQKTQKLGGNSDFLGI